MQPPNINTSESELIYFLQNGEDKGYAILCERYSAMMFGIILRIVVDHDCAENLLQDCFIKVWRNIQTYDDLKGTFATWLINIARHTAIDFIRSKYFSQKQKNQSLHNFVFRIRDISKSDISPETIGLKQIIEKLPRQYQEAIDCLYFKGYTQQEYADEYSLPLGTVKTRIRMAIIELRKYFN